MAYDAWCFTSDRERHVLVAAQLDNQAWRAELGLDRTVSVDIPHGAVLMDAA